MRLKSKKILKYIKIKNKKGIAKIRGLCNGVNSAAIVEDGGLNAAFTIAHEIGHLLVMVIDYDISTKFVPWSFSC